MDETGPRGAAHLRTVVAALVAVAVGAPAAVAEPSADPAARPSAEPSVWSGLGAVVAGLVVPGTGHRIAGDSWTANRLLILAGIGLGVGAVGAAVVGGSGASRVLSPPAIPLLVSGVGTFLVSWGADIYGAVGGACMAGEPARSPRLEVRLGYLRVHDPQFRYDHFSDLEIAVSPGRWTFTGEAKLAADADNQRVRLVAGYRLLGARPDPDRGRAREPGRPGEAGEPGEPGEAGEPDEPGERAPATRTGLELRAGLLYHRYGDDDFAVTTGELALVGRYDLIGLSPTLGGSFAELELGAGVERTGYQLDGVAPDLSALLLLRFAYGVYLGRPGGPFRGQARVFYNHRRDTLAGGLALAGGANGFVGSFGADGFLYWSRRWGAAVRVQVGSSYIGGLGLLFRIM